MGALKNVLRNHPNGNLCLLRHRLPAFPEIVMAKEHYRLDVTDDGFFYHYVYETEEASLDDPVSRYIRYSPRPRFRYQRSSQGLAD